MKRLLLGLIALAPFAALAQPNVTNLESGATFLSSVTNISFAGYGVYTSQHKAGGGFIAAWNFNANVGTGLGVEDVGNNLEVINGNIQLKLPTHPFGFMGLPNIVTTPWAGAFLGKGVGASSTSGAAIGTGGGLYVDVASLGNNWELSLGGGAVNWSGAGNGFDGWHYLGFLAVHHGF